jgi:predicted negative regulator of RcsB-dependent stress response
VPGYTRRQLKEDKFAETAKGAAHWAGGHRQTVIWAASIILIVVLALAGLWTWHLRQTEQANLELGTALRTFKMPLRQPGAPTTDATPGFATIAERGKAAEKQLESVADKFPYTSPGKIARYLEGVASMQAGDNAAAEQQLKTATDFRDKDIAALAKLSLATLYRSTNRSPDALKIYKDLVDHPTTTVPKAEAQLELAEMYETADPQQAASIYEQLQKEDPQSPAAQIAAAKLAKTKQFHP